VKSPGYNNYRGARHPIRGKVLNMGMLRDFRRATTFRYVCVAIGATWCGIAVWFVKANIIVRETRLGAMARIIDQLPSPMSGLVFALLWFGFLMGWLVPLVIGLRGLSQLWAHTRKPNS
jgi:hypothetical protein